MPFRSPVLDGLADDLVSLEGCAGHGQAGNGRRLASGWFPFVLVLEIWAAWRPAEDHSRNSRADSALGAGELRLGRAEDPRRVAEARLGALREDRGALFAGIHRRGDPAQKWLAFLHNHREAIVAFDLFTVPSATFRVWYCFFVIEHERRWILHFNVTRHPSADWIVQQLRETLPEAAPYRYAILDHDAIFNVDVMAFLKATGF
jgi:hypothetical protein